MPGMDNRTGRWLDGYPHLVQSLRVLFTTRLYSRLRRRLYGSQVPGMLGRNTAPSTFLTFATAVHVAVELWEPRYRLVQVAFPQDKNSPDKIRKGRVGLALIGEYRPRALQGDFTPEATTDPYILI